MEINPAIVVQSALALVMALTTIDVVKSTVEVYVNAAPENIIKYKIIALMIVLIMIYILIHHVFIPTGSAAGADTVPLYGISSFIGEKNKHV